MSARAIGPISRIPAVSRCSSGRSRDDGAPGRRRGLGRLTRLDPRKPIASTVKPLRVQVVSLDWKWLFIYPDQGIASVNQLAIPVGTPVSFELTSSGVMNSFFVPQLGSQIYTMAGMVTRLHLQADHPGTYRGMSANTAATALPNALQRRSCAGRKLRAMGRRNAQRGPVLDAQAYAELAKPSRAVAPFTYVRSRPNCSTASCAPKCSRRCDVRAAHPTSRGRKNKSTWQAQLECDPVRPADHHGRDGAAWSWSSFWSLRGSPSRDTWPYLWREWITSVDHKRIGIMYIMLALIMLLRGFADAIMMRAQQALAAGGAQGYLPPEHFDQIFSAHGTIMIFFMAMPFVIGMMNFVVPLQLGVRDMAFPTLNSVALWLTASGILLDEHLARGRRVRERPAGSPIRR